MRVIGVLLVMLPIVAQAAPRVDDSARAPRGYVNLYIRTYHSEIAERSVVSLPKAECERIADVLGNVPNVSAICVNDPGFGTTGPIGRRR